MRPGSGSTHPGLTLGGLLGCPTPAGLTESQAAPTINGTPFAQSRGFSLPPRAGLTLATDALPASAECLVHDWLLWSLQNLAALGQLRAAAKRAGQPVHPGFLLATHPPVERVVLVTLESSLTTFALVARKRGIDLAQAVRTGDLVVVDPLSAQSCRCRDCSQSPFAAPGAPATDLTVPFNMDTCGCGPAGLDRLGCLLETLALDDAPGQPGTSPRPAGLGPGRAVIIFDSLLPLMAQFGAEPHQVMTRLLGKLLAGRPGHTATRRVSMLARLPADAALLAPRVALTTASASSLAFGYNELVRALARRAQLVLSVRGLDTASSVGDLAIDGRLRVTRAPMAALSDLLFAESPSTHGSQQGHPEADPMAAFHRAADQQDLAAAGVSEFLFRASDQATGALLTRVGTQR
ncbi:hypothetical protein H696_03492 [Fonticula alba]|uniref:Uncharacterized protein n=1 Tax=Fonticula alba TaxID=691883 RepID=A0A058Z7G0_FONAL|nr:hypothetical protein H696_03492 [Fonticula alba]KCV70026.1 hypothetical protein H696_03492 [Fonticula alba]|eukprot:XP_009495632.1 hypothetical protein H696_03492 [Fonticula alba]